MIRFTESAFAVGDAVLNVLGDGTVSIGGIVVRSTGRFCDVLADNGEKFTADMRFLKKRPGGKRRFWFALWSRVKNFLSYFPYSAL